MGKRICSAILTNFCWATENDIWATTFHKPLPKGQLLFLNNFMSPVCTEECLGSMFGLCVFAESVDTSCLHQNVRTCRMRVSVSCVCEGGSAVLWHAPPLSLQSNPPPLASPTKCCSHRLPCRPTLVIFATACGS